MDAETREFQLKLQRAAQKATEDYIRLAEKKFGRDFIMPRVHFNDLGTTAGRAWPFGHPKYGRGIPIIEYSPRLLRLNNEDFLVQTTGHEVAHIVAWHLWQKTRKIDPHGAEWRNVMWAFSLPAKRCHNYDVGDGRAQKKVDAYTTSDGKNVVERRGAKVITFE